MKRKMTKMFAVTIVVTLLLTNFSFISWVSAKSLSEPGMEYNQAGELLGSKSIVSAYGIKDAYELKITNAKNDINNYFRVEHRKTLNFNMEDGKVEAVKITIYIKPIKWTYYDSSNKNINFNVQLRGKPIGNSSETLLATASISINQSNFSSDRFSKLDLVLVKDAVVNDTTYKYALYKYVNSSSQPFGAINTVSIDNYLSTITSVNGYFQIDNGKENLEISAYISDWSVMEEVDRNYVPSIGTQNLSSQDDVINKYLITAVPGSNFELPENITVADFYSSLNSPYDDFQITDETGNVWTHETEGSEEETMAGKYIFMDGLYSKVLTPSVLGKKTEDFSDVVIVSAPGKGGSAAVNMNGNDVSTSGYAARTAVSVANEGWGGKLPSDKYLKVSRNRGTSTTEYRDYFAFTYESSAGVIYQGDLPVNIELSIYIPVIISQSDLQIGFTLRDDGQTTNNGYLIFTTDSSKENIGSMLNSSWFYVKPYEWNRIRVRLYPNTSYTDITVNGVRTEFSQINSNNVVWGKKFRQFRLNLPNHGSYPDFSFAVDDVVAYRGSGEGTSYSEPSCTFASNDNNIAVHNPSKTVMVKSPVTEGQITAALTISDSLYEYVIVKDSENYATKIAVWESGNPIPKYYTIEVLPEGMVELLSFTGDINTRTFTAVLKGNGESVGNMIVAAYSDGLLVNIVMVPKRNIFGIESITYEIENYNPSLTYKAFYWDSLTTLEPLSDCVEF